MTISAQGGPQIAGSQDKTAQSRVSFSPVPETPRGSAATPPPADLSSRSQARWCELHAAHDFAIHEDYVLEGYLAWDDVATALRREAKGLRGRERDRKLKAAENAATASLRYWRALRFVDPAAPPRRPGRPPGRRPPVPVSSLTIGGGGHADGTR